MKNLLQRCSKTGKIIGLNKPKGFGKISFFILGFAALIWFLIRVIPKPSRINYPCMKATMPIAYSFIIYLASIGSSVFFYRKAVASMKSKKLLYTLLFVGLSAIFVITAFIHNNDRVEANPLNTQLFVDPIGPNSPIGTPKGIFPGRVVWVFNSNATNQDCVPYDYGDGYFLDKNCNQLVVDTMVSQAIISITGGTDEVTAWDSIFRFFNRAHEKGDTGYTEGEKIFIKINSVHAWNTQPNGDISNTVDYGNVDTSPQVVWSILNQLVNKAGIPQNMIYIGDPFTQMFNHCFNKWAADFPDVHYMVRSAMTGREVVTKSDMKTIHFSDGGQVLSVSSDNIVDCISNADYIVNIPAMKGHRWGGVTFFAKNFFAANSRGSASHMHPGLFREDYIDDLRLGYKQYRVFVDLMGSKVLGENTLLWLMDGLWATSEEHRSPAKFYSEPFNNNWSSSILASLDPVAIESVCIDIMQKEFKVDNVTTTPQRFAFVQWDGIDDYLHQAASSDWWPDSIVYDPDLTGSPMPSLGVHEHWNNEDSMQYSRNLGTGSGIELVRIFSAVQIDTTDTTDTTDTINQVTNIYINTGRFNLYPNPVQNISVVSLVVKKDSRITLDIYSSSGIHMNSIASDNLSAGEYKYPLSKNKLLKGMYLCVLKTQSGQYKEVRSIKFAVN